MTGQSSGLPDGWGWIEECPDRAEKILAELERELPSGHPLADRVDGVIAISFASDDVLFRVRSPQNAVAHVHLTWSGKSEREGWPTVKEYPSLDAWLDHAREYYAF